MPTRTGDTLKLTVHDLLPSIKQRLLEPSGTVSGERNLELADGRSVHLAFFLESDWSERRMRLKLRHVFQGKTGPVSSEEVYTMQSTVPGFGGRRWWFICPSCRKQRTYLVLVPDGSAFACLGCAEGEGQV